MKSEGKPGPYAVLCDHQGTTEVRRVYLTPQQYDAQMNQPDSTWRCPICKGEAEWDDENFERHINKWKKEIASEDAAREMGVSDYEDMTGEEIGNK